MDIRKKCRRWQKEGSRKERLALILLERILERKVEIIQERMDGSKKVRVEISRKNGF